MSSRLRASSCATSQGTARRAPSRGASAGVQAGVSARRVSGVMNHSRFQVAILSSAGAALAPGPRRTAAAKRQAARFFMRATIACGARCYLQHRYFQQCRASRVPLTARRPRASTENARHSRSAVLPALGRGRGGRDEGLAIGRDRDRAACICLSCWPSRARDRPAARPSMSAV